MFEIGFWELVMVGVVALIVVGPERLPGLARTAGLWLGKARRMIADVKAEVDRELHLEEIKQTLRQQANLGEVKDLTDQVKSLRQDIQAEFDDPGPPPGWQPGLSNAPPPPGWTPPGETPEPLPGVPAPVRLRKPETAPAAPEPPPVSVATSVSPSESTAPRSPSPPTAN
ncbi:MAG: Sec-independent protein translocase protein TatB [Candidatus Competibacter sp.]|nr:Sec-independent protein translocase protein TatB [Candidatus Competibacter sp.]